MDAMKLQGLVSLLNRFPALRKILRLGSSVALASIGGVGSTALARHIGSIADKTPREHAYSPVLFEAEKDIKLGFVFGNPYNSILSIFRRNYQSMHVKAMNDQSDTIYNDLKNISLLEYLERGVDEFYLERQLSNWTNQEGVKHPTILIKYEGLEGNIEKILEFFECSRRFVVKSRTSSWEQQPKEVRLALQRMYGEYHERVMKMEDITILQP